MAFGSKMFKKLLFRGEKNPIGSMYCMVANFNKSNVPWIHHGDWSTQTNLSLHFFIASQFFPGKPDLFDGEFTFQLSGYAFGTGANLRVWDLSLKKWKGTIQNHKFSLNNKELGYLKHSINSKHLHWFLPGPFKVYYQQYGPYKGHSLPWMIPFLESACLSHQN